mmetsp:Transcript_58640/g.148612  ORF Transcript_58640/g.148612 Transcript_58640/m.148612 type:complete len:254 (+) Transcript_58640:1-762(+)
MVRVEDHGHAVELSHCTHVQGARHATGDARRVVGVVGPLPGDELTAAFGECDHDWASRLLRRLHACIDRASADDVDTRDGKFVLLGVVEQVDESLARYHARLHRGRHLRESCLLHGGRRGADHAACRSGARGPLARVRCEANGSCCGKRPASAPRAAALLLMREALLLLLQLRLLLLLAEALHHLTFGGRGHKGSAKRRGRAISACSSHGNGAHLRRHREASGEARSGDEDLRRQRRGARRAAGGRAEAAEGG